jgi:hypothetical protein
MGPSRLPKESFQRIILTFESFSFFLVGLVMSRIATGPFAATNEATAWGVPVDPRRPSQKPTGDRRSFE